MTSRPVTVRRFACVAAAGLAVALAAVAASLLVGEDVDVAAVAAGRGTDVHRQILLELRLPRTLAAALVGAALGVAGAAYQALLRNPLAEPYLLGVSGGGSFGAVLAIVALGATGGGALTVRGAAALAGCLLALGVVYLIATRRGALHPATLLLAGAVVNSFFLAALSLAQVAASPTEAQAILRWVLGGVTYPQGAELAVLAVVVPAGAAAVLALAGPLNALSFGEETARHLGVDVERTRRLTFAATSGMVAVSVAVAGPVGFVGLFLPHAARLAVGSDLRLLVPASFFAGAAFLPLADALARTVLAPQEIPVGVVTAMVGAPVFVVLLARFRAAHGGVHG